MAGPWDKYSNSGKVFTVPRSAEQDAEEARKRAAERRAEEAAARAATAERRAQENADREARQWAATHNPDGTPKAVPTPQQAGDRADRIRALNILAQQINRVQELGNQGPLSTSGLGAIADYSPFSSANAQFDTAGAQLSQQGLAAFRVPGTGTVSDRDALMFDRGNLPEASKLDASNAEILNGLRRRTEAEFSSYGLPAPKWVLPAGQQKPRNVMDEITIRAPDITAAPPGSDKRALPYPPGFQEEYAAYMAQNMNGNMDPAAYAAFRNAHAQKYGYGPQPAGYYEAEAQQLNDYYNQGGRTIGGISPIEEDMTTSQMINNALANNPLSVAAMNAGDAGSGGLISAVAGDKVNMLNQANPNAALVGQIGGAILGAEGTGAIGRATLGKLAPMLMRGGRGAALGRGLAADATYSGVYGANTGQDPFESALLGGAGSLIGRGVGKATGAAIGGVSRLPAPAMLNRAGVPTTVGQNLGGIAKRVEDRAMSMPVIGDMIAKRRMESFNAFNRAAQNEAGAPIGAQFDQAGNWTDELPDQFGQAYDNATAGAQVPLDAQFAQDMMAARAAGDALPPDMATKFNAAVNNRVAPAAMTGQLTGDTYQQAMRGLKGYKAELSKPGFEADYRDALGGVQDALRGQMVRGGDDSVVSGLAKADEAYRMGKVVQDAQRRAINGSGSGKGGIFTPAQLNTAAMGNLKKFGGNRPFAALADAGQEVLPSKIPETGTAGRLWQLLLPTALGGAGYAANGTEGLWTAGGLMTLLALGATKHGQKGLNKLLFDRPDAAKALGAAVRKKQGLFGAASIPLLLESQ